MPGMNSGLNVYNHVVVATFHTALIHQAIIALAIFLLLATFWGIFNLWRPASFFKLARGAPADGQMWSEPQARRLLRIGFGILWIFDGLLQAQSAMAIGLPSQVIEPVAATSPTWAQHVANWAATSWSYHPIQAGASAVWIQIGVGIWMLVAPRGLSSRLAGLVGLGWGIVVWVFGEVFGGILAGGQSWMFGAPGAAAFYSVAGALIALPERTWRTARMGRAVLAASGLFFMAMSVLQAWPGRGFWQGASPGHPGSLASMVGEMAQMPQPGTTSRLVSAFGAFDLAHGFAVNLFIVAALAAVGLSLVLGRRRLLGLTVVAVAVLCLADWIFVQDFGFLGGVGTDPNSMLPILLIVIGGYLALTRVPAELTEPAVTVPAEDQGHAGGRRQRALRAALGKALATPSLSFVLSIGAFGVIVLGAGPMAAAQADSRADPILAEAVDGQPVPADRPAPEIRLVDQHGRQFALTSLRGKVVFLTFLDPVASADSRLIATEVRTAAGLLNATSRDTAVVAVTLNPSERSLGVINKFDRRVGLTGLPGWLFLTGTTDQLRRVWQRYSVYVQEGSDDRISYSDVAYVIDRSGNIRYEINTSPGPGTAATKASFAVLFANSIRQTLATK